MSTLTRQSVAVLLQQREIAYHERDVLEVRSFWKDACVDVPDREVHRHTCKEGAAAVEIRLHPFKTVYGRTWRIGGCSECKKLFYYPIPLTEKQPEG